jgi:hypothetical protein
MNNKIKIGVLTKENTTYTQGGDETLLKIKDNVTASKNQLLRDFMHNTDAQYFLLYNTNSELRVRFYNELIKKAEEYINAINSTGICFFAGILIPKTTLDYGDIKINVGTGDNQKVTFEVFTRTAINTIGYLDVRLQDTLCSQDYAIRLGYTKHYPTRASKTTPWLFDIEHNNTQYAKQVLDTYVSGWYQYKHGVAPWEQFTGNIDDLKPLLKEIKNGSTTV